MLPPSKEQPELNSSMPLTTSGRVDEKGESIPRSLSASKIELAPSDVSETDVQSHTLNRYQQKQKKLRQNPTDSDVSILYCVIFRYYSCYFFLHRTQQTKKYKSKTRK